MSNVQKTVGSVESGLNAPAKFACAHIFFDDSRIKLVLFSLSVMSDSILVNSTILTEFGRSGLLIS